VGGAYGEGVTGGTPALVVRVSEGAVEGAATAAMLAALADAFGVRKTDVRLVAGERSRTKVVEIDPAPEGAQARLADLLERT
jgi:uncharacterized protein YggU (UPF0235/DUF167 family)